MTNSNPLSKLSREYRLLIEDAYKSGKSPEQIGIEYGLDFEEVQEFCSDVSNSGDSRYEKLSAIIESLEDVLSRVKDHIDADGVTQAMYLQSYQKLINEYRIALGELEELKKPEDVIKELMERVLNPFVMELVKVCTEETNKLKQELVKRDVPNSDAQSIAMELFKRLADRLKSTMPESHRILNTYFGIKNDREESPMKDKILQ